MKEWQSLVRILREQVRPAMGCTEPVAVAWTVARAREELGLPVERAEITVSLNVYKNGMGVGIPGTSAKGLEMAAALGAAGGDSLRELEVMESITTADVQRAQEILEEGRIIVNVDKERTGIYIFCKIASGQEDVEITVEGGHTNITAIYRNGRLVWGRDGGNGQNGGAGMAQKPGQDLLQGWTFKELREAIEAIPVDELRFLLDGVSMNLGVAEMGLQNRLGLGVGAGIYDLTQAKVLSSDMFNEVKFLSAAAADARMSGTKAPVMSSGGSGNQGIGAIVPLAVASREYGWPEERLVRALAYSHLVNVYIKEHTGKLSAACGCAIAAGIGAGVGIAWGLGGDDHAIAGTVKNMTGNLAGMICDGAKGGCALKLATSGGEALVAAQLALRGVIVSANDGIVSESAEETIRNLGMLATEGMTNTDQVIVDVMTHKAG